mgnify:CR=1 FL=1
MINFDIVEVVERLIGETEPCGDSNDDFDRWHNQKSLILLTECLIDILLSNSKYAESGAGSMSKIGKSAKEALIEIKESIDNL